MICYVCLEQRVTRPTFIDLSVLNLNKPPIAKKCPFGKFYREENNVSSFNLGSKWSYAYRTGGLNLPLV